jgi:hypothetical protein
VHDLPKLPYAKVFLVAEQFNVMRVDQYPSPPPQHTMHSWHRLSYLVASTVNICAMIQQ